LRQRNRWWNGVCSEREDWKRGIDEKTVDSTSVNLYSIDAWFPYNGHYLMASPNMRPATKPDTAEAALRDPHLIEAIARNVVGIEGQSVTYHIGSSKTYDWGNPEEWVRARTIAFLVVARDYPAKRVGTEVTVPSRTGGDRADVVVFRDDEHRDPYLVVECKPVGSTDAVERQAIEQAFGYGGSFRSAYVLYDQYDTSRLFDLAGFPSGERVLNVLGSRDAAPHCYGEAPAFALGKV